ALRKRLAGRKGALLAVLVVPVDAAFFDGNEQEPGMAMPPGLATRSHGKILEIELRMPPIFEQHRPFVADLDVVLERVQRAALREQYIRYDTWRFSRLNNSAQKGRTGRHDQRSVP